MWRSGNFLCLFVRKLKIENNLSLDDWVEKVWIFIKR